MCGARLDDDGACRDCDIDLLPLTDADIGIRREDRYVALPPGPRWVPRRVRRESSTAPVVVLGIVLTVLVVAGVLRQGGPTRVGSPTSPLLAEHTGVTLVRTGPLGLERIDVDGRRIRSWRVPEVGASHVRELVTVDNGIIALTGPGAVALDDRGATWLGDADAVVPSPEGARLVSYPRPGEIVVTPPGVTLEVRGEDGHQAVGEVVAVLSQGSLVQRVRRDGVTVLELYSSVGVRLLAVGETFVTASGDTVVTRPRCPEDSCPSLRVRGPHGVQDLDYSATTVSLAPGEAHLAVLTTEDSVMIDLETGNVRTIAPGAIPTDRLAWSRDGRWLFVVTADGNIDAIGVDGHRYQVPVAGRATDALAVL